MTALWCGSCHKNCSIILGMCVPITGNYNKNQQKIIVRLMLIGLITSIIAYYTLYIHWTFLRRMRLTEMQKSFVSICFIVHFNLSLEIDDVAEHSIPILDHMFCSHAFMLYLCKESLIVSAIQTIDIQYIAITIVFNWLQLIFFSFINCICSTMSILTKFSI